MPPAIWKKPMELVAAVGLIPRCQLHHVFDTRAHRRRLHVAADARRGEHVAERGILPARHHHGEILLRRGNHPRILGIDLVVLLERAAAQNFKEELVREEALAARVGALPFLHDGGFETAHGFLFGNARVRDTIQMPLEQFLFVGRGQIAIVRDAFVEIVRDQVVEVFLEVGARARNRVHLALADHLGQREPQLRGAHGTRERDHHLAAAFEVAPVGVGRVDEGRRIEVTEMMANERADGRLRGCHRLVRDHADFGFHGRNTSTSFATVNARSWWRRYRFCPFNHLAASA